MSGIRPIVLPERFFGLTSHSINTSAHYAETTELLTAACKHTIATLRYIDHLLLLALKAGFHYTPPQNDRRAWRRSSTIADDFSMFRSGAPASLLPGFYCRRSAASWGLIPMSKLWRYAHQCAELSK